MSSKLWFIMVCVIMLTGCSTSWSLDTWNQELWLSEFDKQAKMLIENLDQEEINDLKWQGENIQINAQ